MSTYYPISEDEWFAMGLDEVDDEPEETIEILGLDHPSMSIEERNPSMRSQRLY